LAHSKPNIDLTLIVAAKHHNPFAYLGPHNLESKHTFRAFLPYASKVWINVEQNWCALDKTHTSGLFEFKKDFANSTIKPSKLPDTATQKPCQPNRNI